jgi:hypothetical protein
MAQTTIDLKRDGNAHTLISLARNFCKQMDQRDKADAILAEMISGDYEHLVAVFKEEFKHVVNVIDSTLDEDRLHDAADLG